MEDIEAATKTLLQAADDGELKRLKKTAAAIDRVFGGGGVAAVIENTKDDHGRGAIHYAATGGSVNVLKYLIQEIKIDVNLRDGDGATPLFRATIRGHLAAVEYLLGMGANPELRDHGNLNPLHFAALKGHGHEHIIPLLLSKGIDVDDTNHYGSPLHYAASFGTPETVKVLLDHGAN
ncbi:hypothetical protein MKW94_020669, partial [Papaver nudicaule]|nr:hypothetical protein [Papaver nudicaule]